MLHLIAYNFQGNFILTKSMQLLALSHATSSELVKAILFRQGIVWLWIMDTKQDWHIVLQK